MEVNSKSKGVGNILLLFLWVGLILSIFSLATTVPYVYAYDFYYHYLASVDHFVSSFNFVLYYITVIIFLVWMYRIHTDIIRTLPNYNVTPGGALIRLMVPFVNIWGLWNTFSNLSRLFKATELGSYRAGARLYLLIPFLYLTLYSTSILNRYILREPEFVGDTLIAVTVTLEVGMSLVFLMMAKIITNAMKEWALLKAAEKQEEQQIDASIELSNTETIQT
jgi:hypothetical protein